MGWFLKWGNYSVAKYMEFLFNTPSFTDVGCTMRLIKRQVLNQITPHFTIGGSHFGPQMMLLSIWTKRRVIEIPLNYKERIGKSMVTGNQWEAFKLGIEMIALISRFRLSSWLHLGPHKNQQQ